MRFGWIVLLVLIVGCAPLSEDNIQLAKSWQYQLGLPGEPTIIEYNCKDTCFTTLEYEDTTITLESRDQEAYSAMQTHITAWKVLHCEGSWCGTIPQYYYAWGSTGSWNTRICVTDTLRVTYNGNLEETTPQDCVAYAKNASIS